MDTRIQSSPATVGAQGNAAVPRRGVHDLWDRFGMVIVFLALFALCALFVDNFLSLINMRGLALSVSLAGMVACGMLFCLAAGDFDLSVGSVVACSGVGAAVLINLSESVTLGIAGGIALGVVFGAVNGFIVARLQINALITTLASMQIARGLGYIISDGKAVGISEEGFFVLGNADVYGLPIPVLLTIVCFVLFGFLMSRTVFGRIPWPSAATRKRRASPGSM